MKIQDIYKQLTDNAKTNSIIEKANKIHGFKPFVKEFEGVYRASEIVRVVLGAISIFTGVYFMLQLLDVSLFISIPLAVIVFVLVELGKNVFLQHGFAFAFRSYHKEVAYTMIALGIGLLSISVLFSFIGTQRLSDKVNQMTLNDVNQVNKAKLDSVNAYYDIEIENINNELQDFKNSITYKGKINIHNKAVSETIKQYNDRLNYLHESQKNNVIAVIATNNNVFTTTKTKLEGNKNALVILSMLFEFGIFICLLFRSFYLYKVHNEKELIGETTFEDFQEMQKMYLNKPTISLPMVENKASNIGFRQPSQDEQNSLAEMYEKEIEETENKYKIPIKPCKICLTKYQPKTKDSCYCDSCKGRTSSYITMNITRLKKFESKKDLENAEKRKTAINYKIAEVRNIKPNDNLYKEFY